MKTAFKLFQILRLNSRNVTLTLLRVVPTLPYPHLCHSREGGNPVKRKNGQTLKRTFPTTWGWLDSRLRGNDTERDGNDTKEEENDTEGDENDTEWF